MTGLKICKLQVAYLSLILQKKDLLPLTHPLPKYIVPGIPGGVKISRWQKKSLPQLTKVLKHKPIDCLYLQYQTCVLLKAKCGVRCEKHGIWVHVRMLWVQIHSTGKSSENWQFLFHDSACPTPSSLQPRLRPTTIIKGCVAMEARVPREEYKQSINKKPELTFAYFTHWSIGHSFQLFMDGSLGIEESTLHHWKYPKLLILTFF